jgi:multicomponent Na+:H+ antiporter subunit E
MRNLLSYILFFFYYLWALVISNIRLAKDILFSPSSFSPSIIRVEVPKMRSFQLLLLSNLLSMTPGTLTVDVIENNGVLLVHLLNESSEEELRSFFLPRFYRLVLLKEDF